LQREARSAGADGEHGAVAGRLQHDLRSFRQLAHDVVDHMRRHRGRAAGRDLRRDRLVHLEIEIGCFQRELRFFRADQDVGEDRNGIAPLDHAMDMSKRFEELGPLDRDFHLRSPPEYGTRCARRGGVTIIPAVRDRRGRPGRIKLTCRGGLRKSGHGLSAAHSCN
jgi:hypothetical protein